MAAEWFSGWDWLLVQGPGSWKVQSMTEGWAVVWGRRRGDPVCVFGWWKESKVWAGWLGPDDQKLGHQRRGLDFVIMQSVGSYGMC